MGGGLCFGSQSVMVGKAQQADLTEGKAWWWLVYVVQNQKPERLGRNRKKYQLQRLAPTFPISTSLAQAPKVPQTTK